MANSTRAQISGKISRDKPCLLKNLDSFRSTGQLNNWRMSLSRICKNQANNNRLAQLDQFLFRVSSAVFFSAIAALRIPHHQGDQCSSSVPGAQPLFFLPSPHNPKMRQMKSRGGGCLRKDHLCTCSLSRAHELQIIISRNFLSLEFLTSFLCRRRRPGEEELFRVRFLYLGILLLPAPHLQRREKRKKKDYRTPGFFSHFPRRSGNGQTFGPILHECW